VSSLLSTSSGPVSSRVVRSFFPQPHASSLLPRPPLLQIPSLPNLPGLFYYRWGSLTSFLSSASTVVSLSSVTLATLALLDESIKGVRSDEFFYEVTHLYTFFRGMTVVLMILTSLGVIGRGWGLHRLRHANKFQVIGLLNHHISISIEWGVIVELVESLPLRDRGHHRHLCPSCRLSVLFNGDVHCCTSSEFIHVGGWFCKLSIEEEVGLQSYC